MGHQPTEEEFAAPVLHGRRFDGHAIPLDVLKELETYQRLIVDVAKALFLQRHNERQRLPKGFEARLQLSLRQVEEGSAMPVLLRAKTEPLPGQATLLPLDPDDFELARDLISDVVKSANDGAALPRKFPRALLVRFNQFGRSLLPDESIELRASRQARGPSYNHAIRKKLVLMEEKSISNPVDLEGRIFEANVEKGTFQVDTHQGKVPGCFSKALEQQVATALKEHERLRVRLLGTGRFDAQDRLKEIEELDDILFLEEGQLSVHDLEVRVEELKQLQKGWLDGDQGDPLDHSGLEQVHALLAGLAEQEELPIPYLYPTVEGCLRAEWTVGTWELSAVINLAEGTTSLDAVDADTGAGKEGSLNLFEAGGRLELVGFVSAFRRKATP